MAAKKRAPPKAKPSLVTDPALAAAIAKWRTSRDPADADLVDELGKNDAVWPTLIAPVARTSGGSDQVVARMQSAKDLEDDPRLTVAILGWLIEARWPGSGSREGWQALFERLVKLRDARAIVPLCQMAKDLPPFVGIEHRAFMMREIARTADELERATPKVRVTKPLSPRKPGAAADSMSIIQRVFDDPFDDDLRRVVADELLESGDPWGEFIQLGFLIEEGRATDEQKAASEALIKKYPATLGGPLMKIAKTDSREFRKGFLWRVLTNASMVARPAWEAAATTPYWRTVTRLEFDMTGTPKWWMAAVLQNPALKNLREVHFNRYFTPQISLARESEPAPWRVVAANEPADPAFRGLLEFVSALPPEEQTRIEVEPKPECEPVRHVLLEHAAR